MKDVNDLLTNLRGGAAFGARMQSTEDAALSAGSRAHLMLTPMSFAGADVFDDSDTMDVFLFVPNRMFSIVEARAMIRFREYFASARAVEATTSSPSAHRHTVGGWVSDTPGRYDVRNFLDGAASPQNFDIATESAADLMTDSVDITVDIGSTSLVYGVYKEPYPASHSVTINIYYWDNVSAWVLAGTLSGIIADFANEDLTEYITFAGIWRLEFQSDPGQPNGGRLGCDVSGYVLGAIQGT